MRPPTCASGLVYAPAPGKRQVSYDRPASVDHSVGLVGLGGVITWHLEVRCKLYDNDQGCVDVGSHRQAYMMAREHEGHPLEWVVEGSVAGFHDAPPGDYRGSSESGCEPWR